MVRTTKPQSFRPYGGASKSIMVHMEQKIDRVHFPPKPAIDWMCMLFFHFIRKMYPMYLIS